MIKDALILLKKELHEYLKSKGDFAANVIIDNIGLAETTLGSSLTDNIVITLVNIEEESTLKNHNTLKKSASGSAYYENPAVHINLYILITCNYAGDGYVLALDRLSLVIQFLQSKSSFSNSNSIIPDFNEQTKELKFTMELFTLSFEQINYLWGSLGGRQVPFAMYKLRLITIAEQAIVREVPLIEEIETTISNTNQKS